MTTREKYEDIAKRLREHDGARKLIEAELLSLQHICLHPNKKTIGGRDYSGVYDSTTSCPDCGYVKYH